MRVERVSVCTPVGFSAAQVALVSRAATFEPRTTQLLDARGAAVGMCRVGGITAETHGYDRMMALSQVAIGPLLEGLGDRATGLVVALPEAGRPDDDERFATFGPDLARRSGLLLDEERSVVVRKDRAGVADAVAMAKSWLGRGCSRVIVGGIDSYHHPDVMKWLDEECRLHTYHAEDGFVPGEAAAFFVLTERSSDPAVEILHVATGLDAAARRVPSEGAAPDVGATMTSMVQAVRERWDASAWVISDHNGERHRERWWMFLGQRGAVARGVTHTRLPAAMGDVGAATGAVAVALAHASWQLGVAPADHCLVTLHGEDGERGLLYLEAP